MLPLFLLTTLLTACQASVTPLGDSPAPLRTAFTGGQTQIDRGASSIEFLGRSNIVNHPGSFGQFDAVVRTDPEDPGNVEKISLGVRIDTVSIQVESDRLYNHLMSPEFFDAENFPMITFASTSFIQLGDHRYSINGDLTIKGVTLPVTFDGLVTDDAIAARTEIPRRAFGIGNDAYGDKILDEFVPVTVRLLFAR